MFLKLFSLVIEGKKNEGKGGVICQVLVADDYKHSFGLGLLRLIVFLPVNGQGRPEIHVA